MGWRYFLFFGPVKVFSSWPSFLIGKLQGTLWDGRLSCSGWLFFSRQEIFDFFFYL
jgi:hypothetical protein